MKNISTILSALALIGVIVLFGLHFSNSKSNSNSSVVTSGSRDVSGAATHIAYIDVDTFEANYILLKNKKEEFSKRKDAMEAELQRSMQQIENDARALQAKAKAQSISQAEGEAAGRRLEQMQQSWQARKGTMEEQFSKDQLEFNELLHKELDSYLAEYNAKYHYDYILSYSKSNPQIMYADKRLNITADVIKGMNERSPVATPTPKAK